MVGLGNPGERYARTRHNVGFEVAAEAAGRWGLPKAKSKYGGLYTDGRIGPGGPRVGVLLPQTHMNDSGRAAVPRAARSACGLDAWSRCTTRSTCPSAAWRRASGAGSPGTTASSRSSVSSAGPTSGACAWASAARTPPIPEIVSAWVLGRFREPPDEVRALVESAADALERLVERGLEDGA